MLFLKETHLEKELKKEEKWWVLKLGAEKWGF